MAKQKVTKVSFLLCHKFFNGENYWQNDGVWTKDPDKGTLLDNEGDLPSYVKQLSYYNDCYLKKVRTITELTDETFPLDGN